MRQKVLVIDDEAEILSALKIIVTNQGCSVITKTSAPNINWIAKYHPNLILLDLLLIGQSGDQICKQLKADPRTKSIPVLILSANPISRLKVLSKACGADGFLPKPFEISELTTLINKHINSC